MADDLVVHLTSLAETKRVVHRDRHGTSDFSALTMQKRQSRGVVGIVLWERTPTNEMTIIRAQKLLLDLGRNVLHPFLSTF